MNATIEEQIKSHEAYARYYQQDLQWADGLAYSQGKDRIAYHQGKARELRSSLEKVAA